MSKLKAIAGKAREKFYNGQAAFGVALMTSPVLAFASSDPSTEIISEINKGKGYGVAAATAMVVAVWAITGVYMARRKG